MIQKILDKKPVFTAKLFTVNELQVEVKPGIVHTHHNVERDASVLVLPITDKNEVYLVSQYRYNLGKDILECVAGYIDKDEDPLVAAKRELQEETGFAATEWKTLPVFELSGSNIQTKVHSFIAKNVTVGETHFDESEDIETITMSLDEAVAKVFSGEISMVSSISLILMAKSLQNEGKL